MRINYCNCIYSFNNLNFSEIKIKKVLDTLEAICYNAYCSSETNKHFGAWLSLVERPVRDREVAGSNPVAPIRQKRKPMSGCASSSAG